MRSFLVYCKSFAWRFLKDSASSWKEVVVGVLVAVAILTIQIHYEMIPKDKTAAGLISVFMPYGVLLVLYLGFHLIRTPWLLDRERQHQLETMAHLHQQQIAHVDLSARPAETQNILQAIEQHYEITRLEHHVITGFGGQLIDVYEGEHGVIVEGTLDGARNFRALVLSYRNAPSASRPKVGVIRNVSATINYKYFDDDIGLSVHRGVWLSETGNRVDFGPNDKRYLVVATLDNNGARNAVEREFNSVHPNGVTRPKLLDKDLVGVHIRLIAETEGKAINNYDGILEITKEPEFKIEFIHSNFWIAPHLTGLISEGLQLSISIYDLENAQQFKDERRDEVIAQVKVWETNSADFIGRHLDEERKTAFLNCYPSLEDGIANKHRFNLTPRVKKGEAAPVQQYIPRNWTIHDSIKARTDKLTELANSLLRA